MALTKTQISQLYVSLFGRASEGGGNAYWQTDGGGIDMGGIADTMLETDAAISYFGSTLNSNQAFIEHIYLNTLGKTYAQDSVGVGYWVKELHGGKTKGQVVATLISAALDPDNSGAAQNQFENRVEVSNYTAGHIFEYDEAIPFAGFINGVTDDDATVISAKAAVDERSDAENTTYSIILTKGKDVILGSTGDDRILGLDDTYNVNDTIDGGPGIDTLSLLFFAPEIDTVELVGVENVVVQNANASTNVSALRWSGVEVLTFSNSTTVTKVSQVQEKLTLALENNNQNILFTYADDILLSSDSRQALWVTDSTADVAIGTGGADKITTLDIRASGTNVISLVENDLDTITITGDGNLQLFSSEEDNGNLTRISSVLAAGATGDLTLDMSGVDLTLTGDYFVELLTGSGNDVITISSHDNQVNAGAGNDLVIVKSHLDEKDLLEGGGGTDVLSITSADFIATAADGNILSRITGFEAIGINDELDAGVPLDVSVYGVNSIVIEAGLAGDEALTGFSSGATIEIQTDAIETDILTITMPGASNAGSNFDELNIIFNADLEADEDIHGAVFDVKGINTLFVSTADLNQIGETTVAGTLPDSSDGYELVLSNDGNLRMIQVSGDYGFRFASSLSSRVETILTESMTGDMTLDFSTEFGGTQGLSITSGEGNDTITGSVYSDLIITGGNNDIINLTLGMDQITGGIGADTFIVGAVDVSIATAYSSILDFSGVSDVAIADKITNVSNAITSNATSVDVVSAEASGIAMVISADVVNGMISLTGVDAVLINTLDEWLDVFYLACENSKTAGFEFGGNTYIAEESSSGDSVDSLIELTGVVSITALAATAGANTVIISA